MVRLTWIREENLLYYMHAGEKCYIMINMTVVNIVVDIAIDCLLLIAVTIISKV
jgi:hypothetical protein